MIDYHVHTRLCNHAHGTMEQYIGCAIDKGLSEICFLDHLTLNKQGRDLAMDPVAVPLYIYAARRLAEKYKNRIEVKVGMEVDYTPAHAEEASAILDRFSLDVIGGSVHFVDDENIVSSKNRNSTSSPNAGFYDHYLELLGKLLDYSGFDVICHLDVIKKFGNHPPARFFDKMDEILTRIKYHDLVVEINTSGLSHPAGAVYPAPEILRRCFEKKIPVTFGSDAHRPEQVGRAFQQATAILRNAGYRNLTGFNRRNRYEIPI